MIEVLWTVGFLAVICYFVPRAVVRGYRKGKAGREEG